MCRDRSQLVDMLRAVTNDPLGYATSKLAWRTTSLAGMCPSPGRIAEQVFRVASPAGTGGFFRAPARALCSHLTDCHA